MEKKKKVVFLIILLILFAILLSLFIINICIRNVTFTELKKVNESSNNVRTVRKTTDKNNIDSYTDESVINYVKEVEDENQVIEYFDNVYNTIDKNSIKEEVKNYFVDIVDFIFYNKEIKGYTFDEISNNAKIKIIAIALKIDNKIDKYFPEYKKAISDNGNKVYSGVKERLVTSYLDLTVKICSNKETYCEKAKDAFIDIKNDCKIGWNFIKKIVGDNGNRLKEWYEVYSGKR